MTPLKEFKRKCGSEEEVISEKDFAELLIAYAGTQFNRKYFDMSFGLKNGFRLHFDSDSCLEYSAIRLMVHPWTMIQLTNLFNTAC